MMEPKSIDSQVIKHTKAIQTQQERDRMKAIMKDPARVGTVNAQMYFRVMEK